MTDKYREEMAEINRDTDFKKGFYEGSCKFETCEKYSDCELCAAARSISKLKSMGVIFPEEGEGKKPWESPFVPSGELEQIFTTAEEFRAAEEAPAVRLDHFLFALLFRHSAYKADALLKIFNEVSDEFHKQVEGVGE